MKIIEITYEEYRWPRPRPITNGKHTYSHVNYALVKIETDDGITGLGLGHGGGIERATLEYLKPLLLGADPLCIEQLWAKMWVPKLVGRRGMTTRTISAIDIGLWDIKAKAANMPLWKMLGGFRQSVPSYIAGGYYEPGKGVRELQQEMEDNLRLGTRAVKIKIGGAPVSEDVARVKAVREVIGPEIKLLVDANCAYRAYEAIVVAKRIEEFDVFWFEEPVAPDDYDGHRRLAQATSIPVATGENEYTRYGFRDLIRAEAAAILNPDAKILGGVTEFMKVAALAQAHDLDIAPHGSQDIHIHLMAAIPNGLMLEFYRESTNPMLSRLYKNMLSLNKDGTVTAPDTIGIGVEVNQAALDEYRIA